MIRKLKEKKNSERKGKPEVSNGKTVNKARIEVNKDEVGNFVYS